MLTFLRKFFGRERPPNEEEWHPWRPFLPVRLMNGHWSSEFGQIWRRKQDGRWIYRQDEETAEEYDARQY